MALFAAGEMFLERAGKLPSGLAGIQISGLIGGGVGGVIGLASVQFSSALVGLLFGASVGGLFGAFVGRLIFKQVSFRRDYSINRVVLRWYLYRAGALPWNYRSFLDFAAERILLRKVGHDYIFVHRLLLDYFASLETPSA